MKFAELGPKNPAYLAYSQREAAARGVETPRFARRDAVILFTDFVGSRSCENFDTGEESTVYPAVIGFCPTTRRQR
jgi:hypothetical protein